MPASTLGRAPPGLPPRPHELWQNGVTFAFNDLPGLHCKRMQIKIPGICPFVGQGRFVGQCPPWSCCPQRPDDPVWILRRHRCPVFLKIDPSASIPSHRAVNHQTDRTRGQSLCPYVRKDRTGGVV